MSDRFQFEYVGNFHIHSTFSDGDGTVPEIAKTAAKAGLDFIIFNDHDYLADTLHLEEEGFHEGVRVLMGLEIGDLSHHYLACDIKKMVRSKDSGPQDVIDRVNGQGGFGFLAHPFEKGMPFHDKSIAYPWKDRSVSGFTGIEIWNFSSRWKERVKTVFHGLVFLVFKSRLLKGPSQETLAFWDRACLDRRVVAIGGSDAHGVFFRLGKIRLKPLTYDFLLNTVTVHILLDRQLAKDFSTAKTEIYGAMREGRLFIAHERLAPARGFRFDYLSDDGTHLDMGREARFNSGHIQVKTPKQGEIRLIRNGSLLERRFGQDASFRIKEPGVYRVEVFLYRFPFGWRPWIFSNPIYLR